MSETIEGVGKCLCGAVEVRAKNVKPHVAACHCGMCRTWSGGPLLAVGAGSDVTITGADSITAYPSSEWGERCFCKVCGAHLFYRTRGETVQHFIPAGLLDLNGRAKFTTQIFIDRKPDYYDFKNETKNLTEAEVYAAYAS